MKKVYLQRRRLQNSPSGRYRYEYRVQCRVCEILYWTKTYYTVQPRCRKCAGRQTCTPAKVERKNIRRRGDGYITKQGYHLIFDGKQYVPAHRLAFPDLPKEMVVHHIDGDKLNNTPCNLISLTKKRHREAHGWLEQVSYSLIQAGLIKYDRETNFYSLSDLMINLMKLLPSNSNFPLTASTEGNSECSLFKRFGRLNDSTIEEYAKSLREHGTTRKEL